MSISLQRIDQAEKRIDQISAVTGWKNDEKAKVAIVNGLKSGNRVVAITPRGTVEPTSVESANKSPNLDIFVFTLKENGKTEIQSYRIHLPADWQIKGRSLKRELHMRPDQKRQVDLLSGDNTLFNKRTGKTIVITISSVVTAASSTITVFSGQDKYEF